MPPPVTSSSKGDFLLDANFSAATRKLYARALAKFVRWYKSNGFVYRLADASSADSLFVDWFGELYEERNGRGRTSAQHALFGALAAIPSWRGNSNFPLSRMALSGWKRLRPPVSYPPLTWPLTCVIALRAAQLGYVNAAVGFLVSFSGLLRVSELSRLTARDVVLKKDPRLGVPISASIALLCLRKTKRQRVQFAMVDDSDVTSLLSVLVRGAPSGSDLLFPSPPTMRSVLHMVCDQLGLSSAYVPHSLRHGGATRLFLSGTPIESVMERGRWASTKSTRHYIQTGRALLVDLDTDPTLLSIAESVSSSIYSDIATAAARRGIWKL